MILSGGERFLFKRSTLMRGLLAGLCLLVGACSKSSNEAVADNAPTASCSVEFVILGTGQDAGAPQIGNHGDPAWRRPARRLLATSAALVDHRTGRRYLFEATPDVTEQLYTLDVHAPRASSGGLGLDGVFLTHAHIGHYAGLIYFGREAAGAKNIPVYVTPRFADYLQTNGPWEQLVTLGNIAIHKTADASATDLGDGLAVTPYLVPHRDEYSETVGFLIESPAKKVLFLPDIDSWEEWDTDHNRRIEDMVGAVDYAFLDATFFDDHELPGRDMSEIPHPRVKQSMDLFDAAAPGLRERVRFIHFNHTNPVRDPEGPAMAEIIRRGYDIARRGDVYCLTE